MPNRLVPLLCVLVAACADHANTALDSEQPRVHLAGTVAADGAPLANTTVALRVQDTLGRILSDREDTTTLAGAFGLDVPLDTVLQDARLFLQVVPPYGSGLGARLLILSVEPDTFGRLDSTGLALTVPRDDPGLPQHPVQPLSAAQLVGTFEGRSIPPLNPGVGGAFWSFTLTAHGDSVVGRYEADFQATTVCGNGVGSVTGQVRSDTLHLRMVSDSFSSDDIGTRVTLFTGVTYAPSADTLILTYPVQPGPRPCTWGSPAPLRVLR